MILRSSLWLLSAVGFATAASAQYITGFESPPFISGQIAGQDSWTTSANPATARVLTDAEIAAELMNAGVEMTGETVHNGSQALVVSGAGASNATIRLISGLETKRKVFLDVWVRPLGGGAQGNVFLTMEDSQGERAAAFRFGTQFGSTIDYGTNIGTVWVSSGTLWTTENWYHLTLGVDYGQKTYDFSINGVPVNTSPISFYQSASDDFRQVRIFRGSNQAGMIVDDLAVVPEPASMTLFAIGASALLIRRRR